MAKKGKEVIPSPSEGRSVASAINQSDTALRTLIREAVAEAINPLMARLNKIDDRLANSEKEAIQTKEKINEVERSSQGNRTEIRGIEKQVTFLENQILEAQIDRSRFLLRIQGVPEQQQQEDLKKDMASLLAQLIRRSDKELYKEIITVFRVASGYTVKNNLPREIFVRFSSLATRNVILKASNETELKFKGNLITIRREIPFSIRKRRFKYRKLTSLLLEKKIKFRYLIPEGLYFMYEDQSIKIKSEEQMQEFLEAHGADLTTQKDGKAEPDTAKEEALAEQTTVKLRPRDKKEKGL